MAVAAGGQRPTTKSSTPTMYTARLFNKDHSLDITTNLPARFPIGLTTGWDTPFNQPLADLAANMANAAGFGRTGSAIQTAGKFGQATGQTTQHKWMSGAVWNNGSCITISEIPFVLMAKTNPKEEIMKPFQTLLKMVAPDESTAGLLKAPGPHLIGETVGELGGDILTLQIGSFFTMTPCLLESVNGEFDTQFDQSGTPISLTMSVTVKSFFSVSKQDIEKFFTSV